MTPDPVAVPDGWQVVPLGMWPRFEVAWAFRWSDNGRLASGTYPFIKVSDMNLGGNETYIRTANNFVDEADVRQLGMRPVFVARGRSSAGSRRLEQQLATKTRSKL